MTRIVSVFVIVFMSGICKGQNLVPNPSFEQYDTCPSNGQIIYAIGWSSYRVTPDYYNSCSPDTTNPSYSVPSNIYGFQFGRTGSAYSGLTTRSITGTFREYMGIQLSQPLIQGQQYYASFYASKAEKHLTIASNKIGLRLSTVVYSQSSPTPIDNRALIYTDSIIQDTANWIRISGSFVSDSAYRYLIIGNFFADSVTSYIRYDTTSIYAYYYIDDVYLSSTPDTSDGTIKIFENNYLKVSPNPATDWMVLEARSSGQFSIYDVLGRNFTDGEVSPISPARINVSNFKKGIYFLIFQNSIGKSIKKLIIQ